MKHRISSLIFLFLLFSSWAEESGTAAPPGSAESLVLQPSDILVRKVPGNRALELWVKKVNGIQSIMLTDSSADTQKKFNSFSLRSPERNPVNGSEKRLLNGEFLDIKKKALYFIMDSTPEYSEDFKAEAFRLYVPFRLVYGYSWSREGEIKLKRGMWLNIRTFRNPYGDYSAAFKDNPFILDEEFLPPAVEGDKLDDSLQVLSNKTKGYNRKADTFDADTVRWMESVMKQNNKKKIDLAVVLDTTISMKKHIKDISGIAIPQIKKFLKKYDSARLAVVFYRDYRERYLTRVAVPFTDKYDKVETVLQNAEVEGGRDKPEAVYEGLTAALDELKWDKSPDRARFIFQIGDALPHARSRNGITKGSVTETASRKDIAINCIFLKPRAIRTASAR